VLRLLFCRVGKVLCKVQNCSRILLSHQVPGLSLTDYLSQRQRRVLDGVCFSEVCLLAENGTGISDSDRFEID
jgi:hypothetical protein